MNDIEFLDSFHRNSLPSEEFRHRGHLRLAWLVLSRHRLDQALTIMTQQIKRYAAAQGDTRRYHETLTRFWVHLVNHTMENTVEATSLDELVEKFPILLDKGLPYKHWTSELFNSQEARTNWIAPDILPLPR